MKDSNTIFNKSIIIFVSLILLLILFSKYDLVKTNELYKYKVGYNKYEQCINQKQYSSRIDKAKDSFSVAYIYGLAQKYCLNDKGYHCIGDYLDTQIDSDIQRCIDYYQILQEDTNI